MVYLMLFLLTAFCAGAALAWHLRRRRASGARAKTTFWLSLAGAVLALGGAGLCAFRDWEARNMATALIMPSGLLWLGLAALSASLAAARRLKPALAAIGIFVFYSLAGNSYLGNALMGALENGIPDPDINATPALDAIFSLGGGVSLTRSGRPILGMGGDRIAEGVRWQRAGKTGYLVSSGTSIEALYGKRDYATETKTLWMGLGVPESAILSVPEEVRNTEEEIQAYVRMAEARGFKRMGLITSAWHMPRALALARQAGLDVLPIPADRRWSRMYFSPVFLVPDKDGFLDVNTALREILGRLLGS